MNEAFAAALARREPNLACARPADTEGTGRNNTLQQLSHVRPATATFPSSLQKQLHAADTLASQKKGLLRTREQVFHDTRTAGAFARSGKGAPEAETPGKQKAGEVGTLVNGVLIRHTHTQPHPPTGTEKSNVRPYTAVSKLESSPGQKGDTHNIGLQTDSPRRWLVGRGATNALSPVQTYGCGVEVNVRQPAGPYIHGEDVRFIKPKKRGGIAKCSGIKSLTANGRLMGSEVRAWWPDEAPDDDGYIPGPGETALWQSSPYAVGREMDRFDKRTFNPNMSHKEWLATCKELKNASTKLSEMERSLRNGVLLQAKEVSRQASLVAMKNGSLASQVLSQKSEALSKKSTLVSQVSANETVTVVSAGSHIPGYVMNGSLKVQDWLSPRKPPSESLSLDVTNPHNAVIPDYENLEKEARHGFNVLKTLRGQEVLQESQKLWNNPPKFGHTNPRTERPHDIGNFVYHTHGGQMLKQKRIPISEKQIKYLKEKGSQVRSIQLYVLS